MFIMSSLLPIFLVPFFLSLSDFVTSTRSKIATGIKPTLRTHQENDFSILVPIFGNMSYLKNVDFLKRYAQHVILCTTTKENDKFNQEIQILSDKYGFQIFRSTVPLASAAGKTNPWRIFSRALSQEQSQIKTEMLRDEIIKESFAIVKTKYCIFLDGDTVAMDSFYKLIGLMAEKDFDIASVRILVSKTKTIMEKLQDVEYTLAMDARKIYPWLTSGAGVVAKTEAIQNIMRHHSLFFSGGDIEIGKLAGLLNYKVGHLQFEFYTDVPDTFKAWFKQRMAWFGGGFRHAIINAHSYTWRHPWFFIYTTFLVYGATPLRWYELIKYPQILPFVVALYWVLVFAFNWRNRGWHLFLFPFYSLIQVMIILPCGVYTYFKMSINSDNIGLIKLRPAEIQIQ